MIMYMRWSVIVISTILTLSLPASGAINGSKHDLRPRGSEVMACNFCHTPHYGGGQRQSWAPSAEVQMWTDVKPPMKKKKRPKLLVARICLGCHDGIIGMDIIPELPYIKKLEVTVRREGGGDTWFKVRGEPKVKVRRKRIIVVDTDQEPHSHGHPLGLRMRDVSMVDPSIYRQPLKKELKLSRGRIECSTCHVVHNTTDYQPFLAVDNSLSEMCLSCHKK